MDIDSIIDEWGRGKAWIDNFIREFPTLANLADGISITNVKKAPVVGSVTLANAIKQISRDSVQQLPVLSAEVNGTKLSVDAIVATYLLRRVIFSQDTFGNGTLSTAQMAVAAALTYGFQGLRANVGKVFNQFGTTLETIHYNDIAVEPGVFDASNSTYYHVRTRVTKGELGRLLKAAKSNKKTLWNVAALQELYDQGPQAMDYNRWLSTAQRNAGLGGESNQYDIMTRYGVGPYYDITVYSPQLTGNDNWLMKTKSNSKFGYPRVSLLVLDPAPLSPFGTSRARIASPMVNYGNVYLQSTAKMQLMNADPITFKKGLFTSATPIRRGAQWESQDPNADVKWMEMSNSTLEQFNPVMGYIDEQILSVMGVTGVGGPQANSAYQNSEAVQQTGQTSERAASQVTLVVENALRQYGLTGLDLYICEQVGKTPLIIDDEAKDAINNLGDPDVQVGADNTIIIDWKKYYDRIHTLTVTVDLSISKDTLNQKKQATLQDMLTVESQTGDPNDPNSQAIKQGLTKELIQDTAPDVAKQINTQPQVQSVPAVGGSLPPGQ